MVELGKEKGVEIIPGIEISAYDFARSRRVHVLGYYTYTMDDVTINYTEIGKYCSIASHVCINPVQHPMDRVTQHHMTYRRIDYGFAATDDESIFDWRRQNRVKIGHDVWIGRRWRPSQTDQDSFPRGNTRKIAANCLVGVATRVGYAVFL